MSLRRFNPFSSRRDKGAVDSDRVTVQSERPPSYVSNLTAAPTYRSQATRVQDRHESEPMASASMAQSDNDYAETEFSLFEIPGTGGTLSDSVQSGPRYIYYRVFANDGAIRSNSSASTGDPFLGCIKAKAVAPPHNVSSVIQCLTRCENVDGKATNASLFLTPSSQTSMDGSGKISILQRSGAGSIPEDPLALLLNVSGVDRQRLEAAASDNTHNTDNDIDQSDSEPRYLYYQLYKNNGDIHSKASFDPEEPSLGRIRALHVAPPHTATSIKRCVAKNEQNPLLASGQLYANISGDTPVDDVHVSLFSVNGPGSTPDDPMALVQGSEQLEVLPAEQIIKPQEATPHGRYNQKIKASGSHDANRHDPKWLSYSEGDILYTDGVSKLTDFLGYKCDAYHARNAAGKTGFVKTRLLDIC